MIRGLRGDAGGGVAWAFLSAGYKIIDNLDALIGVLDGIRQAGTPVTMEGCDLTDCRRELLDTRLPVALVRTP